MKENTMRSYIEVEGKPVAFYPYTSNVMDRIFVVKDYHRIPEIKKFREELIHLFQSCKINARLDNKIVFEMETANGKRIFYGFYDWTFAIGFAVQSDPWIKPVVRKED
jgi:hypothetical protein